ncbi:SapC family protein [Paraglaciecola aquimarina]|uniref:SapC family protein n=1 Tax=Paraglaciecola aquimarina TaxID=1235557 RepID=A0ABU3SZ22_9ALTE|nr:SapC family protein [Paraglaciecola aquimarina]MDU0355217.1 SapC family protein [Paraglaciecola aquimarina]
MAQLVELSSSAHRALKLNPDSAIQFVAKQHLLNIRVNEVAQSICNFPLLFNKSMQTGYWHLSAITSFEVGNSLFVERNQWQATYRPSCMQSYPFYLMNSAQSDKDYTIGIDETNPAFSDAEGEVLFESNGKGSMFLNRVKNLLEADIQNDIQTFKFGKTLDELDLLKSINVIVQYQDQSLQTLTGLYTINEDKLHTLSDSKLGELNRLGYLTPLNGILLSISQFNNLVQKHNNRQSSSQIQNVKLELTKSKF